MKLLQVNNLSIIDIDKKNGMTIVNDSSFDLEEKKCLGIVGESGSGKSITCKALLGVLPPTMHAAGSVRFKGRELLNLDKETMREICLRHITMIIQDAMSAFDPLYTIGYQMIETLTENLNENKNICRAIVLGALQNVRFETPLEIMKKYPHQLSGGMLQRCMIALAIAMRSEVIIADEPTSALDTINQREVVKLFTELKESSGAAIIFISHDLGIIQCVADTVAVMLQGRIVEYGRTNDVFQLPKHEYTRYLIDTRLKLSQDFFKAAKEKL